MKKRVSCILALLLVLLTPASANSAPTRLGGTGGSTLEVDEGCPVTVSAEQLTFSVGGEDDADRLTAQVTAVYQMENPTDGPLSVPMAFYLVEKSGHISPALDLDAVSITADGEPLDFSAQEVETDDPDTERTALVYTVDFPAHGGREVAVSYQSRSYGLQEGTSHWTQEFTYLLSPARHWADFGTLDITIATTEEYPYIIDSSLPLEESGAYTYTAHFDGLPEGELVFTLYSRPSITLWDRLYAGVTSYQFTFLFFLVILPLLVLGGAAVLIAVLVRRRRRHR